MKHVNHLVLAVLLSAAGIGAMSACGDSSGDGGSGGSTGQGFAFATDAPSAYTRVDRMGMPAINTAVITSKDAYNAADPADDAALQFGAEIIANLTAVHAALDDDLANLGLTPCSMTDMQDNLPVCVAQAAPLVVPDTLKIDTAQAAGFPNGRKLADPVIDATLAVVLLDLSKHGAGTFASLPLNPPENDVAFGTSFPFLAAPHR